MEPLEQKLAELQVQLKSYVDKAAEEKTQFGTMLSETKTALEGLQKQYDAIDVKLAERHAQTAPPETLEEMLKKDESVCRLMKDRRGMAVFSMKGAQVRNILERKTTITSTAVGLTTTGVLQIDRIPGITPEARRISRFAIF
jgi:transaldolase